MSTPTKWVPARPRIDPEGGNFNSAHPIHESLLRDWPVTHRTPHWRLDDELKHTWTIHHLGKNPIKRNLRRIATGLASGDFSGGTGGYVGWDGEKFAEEKSGGGHFVRR